MSDPSEHVLLNVEIGGFSVLIACQNKNIQTFKSIDRNCHMWFENECYSDVSRSCIDDTVNNELLSKSSSDDSDIKSKIIKSALREVFV